MERYNIYEMSEIVLWVNHSGLWGMQQLQGHEKIWRIRDQKKKPAYKGVVRVTQPKVCILHHQVTIYGLHYVNRNASSGKKSQNNTKNMHQFVIHSKLLYIHVRLPYILLHPE